MAFRSDWKSADQLQADIDAGSIPPAHHLIIIFGVGLRNCRHILKS